MKTKLYVFATAALLIFGCNDDLNEIIQSENHTDAESSTIENTEIYQKIDTPYIDWENIDFFEYRNQNNILQTVIPPWGSGVSVTIPDIIRFDHKKKDGWVLLYNLFDKDLYNPHPMIILYNKYRGVVRFFYYHIQNTPEGSNYLSNAFIFDGNATSHLNFSNDFAQNITEKLAHPFEIQSNIEALNTGVSSGTWYSFDHELAYDPDIKNYDADDISIELRSWASKNSLVDLTGSVDGNISGYIQTSGSSISLFNNLINDISIANTTKNITTSIFSNNKDDVKQTLIDKIDNKVSSGLADAISSSLSKLASEGLNFLSSPLSKLFNSAISTSIDNKQRVNLDLSAKIALKGSLTSEVPIFNMKFITPGTKRTTEIPGYYPYELNDKTLGIFNISAKPIISKQTTVYLTSNRTDTRAETYYRLNPNSFDLIINPAIQSEIVISNVKKDILWIKKYQERTFDNHTSNSASISNLVNITAGNEWYLTGQSFVAVRQPFLGYVPANLAVRVSFTVTPKNGAEPVHIVKTFRPTIDNLGVIRIRVPRNGGGGGCYRNCW